jgi:hypothetical protein
LLFEGCLQFRMDFTRRNRLALDGGPGLVHSVLDIQQSGIELSSLGGEGGTSGGGHRPITIPNVYSIQSFQSPFMRCSRKEKPSGHIKTED